MPSKLKHIVIDGRIRRSSTGRYVDRLLEHIQTLDTTNRYTILLSPGDDWKPTNRKFNTAVCKYKQFSFNPLEQVGFSWQLYKLKPDLVHFTMTQQPVLYFGNIVTTTHDLTMLNYIKAGRLPKWLHKVRMRGYRFLLWQSHRKAKKILVPTEYVKGAVQTYHRFTSRKIVVTLEASEPPLPGKALQPDYAPEKYIMYVGTTFPHKNLRRLINSFEIIHKSHPDLKLLLVGRQEYHSKKLQRWAEKKPHADSIIFTGFVSDAELKWLYLHASCYVFPSLSEGFGLPGLEAMVHGCPVVSSDSTCLPEVYGEAAHYFDPRNIHDIAEKVSEVIDQPTLAKKLTEAGYTQAKKFSWKKMAEETLAVYNEAL